ncbi:STAS domain-containing protein [Desulfonema limicola]|uniref:STAS domain-containing protein n=1 Tax=Desulfonema limicola TaxID=45656 RepID=A0A975GHT2_9BACT|nr:STAS domain-containing protein [Desulfonema limicola]QTA81689.1 STAS domain-containing protein [Desulfonema limicola]
MVKTSDELSWEIVKVLEKLNNENAGNLRTHLLNLFNNKQFKVRFDFSDVKNINTMALNIFTIFSKLLKEKSTDYQLEIINANDDIINLFKMTHLEKTYKIIRGTSNGF